MTNNETKTGLEKLRDKISGALEDMRKYGKGKAQMDWGKGCEMAMEKCLANIDRAIDEEHAAMAKTPISCDKDLIAELKKWSSGCKGPGWVTGACAGHQGFCEILSRYLSQSCDKGLLEELKNWTQKEWKYNGAINCDIEYGFSVAQNQVFEILNRYLPQLSSKQEDK